MDQKRSSFSDRTDVSVVCKVCYAFIIYFTFLDFYQVFFLVYVVTGHKSDIPTTSQCARTAGCRYKIYLS